MTITHISQKRRRTMLLALTGTAAMALTACGGGGVTNPPASDAGANCGTFASSFSCITFDSTSVTYTLTGFGGAEDSTVAPDPTGGTNKAAKVVKSATAETFAGTTVSTGANATVTKIPFDAANTRMSVRVYSPSAGIKVRLKVEDAADKSHSAETEATTTVANAWQTLTFDFARPASGTAPLNFTYTYNKTSIFFDFGVSGVAAGGARTYYFDDIAFIGGTSGGGGGGSGAFSAITFDSASVTYTLTGFGGAEDSSVVADPAGGTNKVAKVLRSATAETFAGTTVSTGPGNSVGKIPFDAANTRMTVRVYSPSAGIKVRLKVEDAADSTHSVETDATTTVANAWETLTFDFANPATGTPALNFAYTYNRVTIFFNFGVSGATAGAKTYYFDDVTFIGGTGSGGGGGGGGTGGTFSAISFDSATTTYTLTGFGGAEDSSVVADPAGGTNKVAKVVKSATAEVWAGTTVSTGAGASVGKIPFDAANTRMTVRVYSPNAGIKVRLKVEDAADATHSAETEATTTVANAWETLTFDFANPASGTAALNFSYTYNKISIFFNFGVAGATTGAKTYYFDDVTFIGGTGSGGGGSGGGGTGTFSPISFDSTGVVYTLTGFGGAEDSSLTPDPANAANTVAKVVKSATAEVWAGTTVSTGANQSVGKIPFDASNTRMTVRVYSASAGIKVRLKVEDAADGTHSAETEATTTVANGWETLTFNFANPASGTAALNFSYTYNKISIFFNFGVAGATTGAKTYYFDDVTFIGGTGGGGGGGSSFSPITFDSASVTYTLTGFGGAEDATVATDPAGGTNKVAKVVKSATAEVWAGTTVSTGSNNSVARIPFDASNTRMTVRVYSPNAGYKVRLKVEDAADGTHSAETEATTTVANAWETLTFDFANPASGTAALNFSYTYNKISIFFNFGVAGATTGAKTYFFDDVTFIGGTGGGGSTSFSPITFDSASVTYTLTGFGGAEDATVVTDPAGGTNKVAKVVKSATAELWAGTTVSTGANLSVSTLPFSAAKTKMTVRVYSPNAGYKVRLKVEDAADGTHSVETEATTTVANAWETLTFDFANPASGTAALVFSFTYNKVSIFFNFGVNGATTGAKTYHFDDLTFL